MTGVKLSIVWSSGVRTSSHQLQPCHHIPFPPYFYTYFVAIQWTSDWSSSGPSEQANVQSGSIFGSKKHKKLCTWLLIFNGQSCRHGMKCFCFYFKYLYLVLRICISYKNLQYFIVKLHSRTLLPGERMAATRTRDNEQGYWLQPSSLSLHWDFVLNGAIEVQSSSMMWVVMIIVSDKPLCAEGL